MQTTYVHSTPQNNQQCCGCLDYRRGVILTGSLFLAFCVIMTIWEAIVVATVPYVSTAWIYYVDFGLYALWILGSIFLIIGGAQKTSGFVLAGYIISIICVVIYAISTGLGAYWMIRALVYGLIPVANIIITIVKFVLLFLMCYGLHGVSRYRNQLAAEIVTYRQQTVMVSNTYPTNPPAPYANQYGGQPPVYSYDQPAYNKA